LARFLVKKEQSAMSQPVGIVAKILLPEDQYKKYVRKEVGARLAEAIFNCLKVQSREYYIFYYLKKESALYAFFFFSNGNTNFLLNHPLLALLKNIAADTDGTSSGYIVATLDAMNLTADDFIYSVTLENGKFFDHKFNNDEAKLFRKDASKNFLKYAGDKSLEMVLSCVVDKNIVARIKKLGEAVRVANLKNNLHKATLKNPIELFNNYFYNGKYFYRCEESSITIYDDISLQELRQTSYGLYDDKGVIVNNGYFRKGIYIATNPTKFRMRQKTETFLLF
jgi:hypothetical protein